MPSGSEKKTSSRFKNKQAAPGADAGFPYLDTPAGILTPGGMQFATRESLLHQHAGALLEKPEYSVGELLKRASYWIKGSDGVGILLSLISLMLLPLLPAVLVSIAGSAAWHLNKSALATPLATPLMKFVGYDIFQLLIAVAPLSYFGMQQLYGHLAAGFLLFLLFRFGILRSAAESLWRKFSASGSVPLNDRVLNMLITRYAISEGITLENTAQMEQDIKEAMRRSQAQREAVLKKTRRKK